jgi:hypothetical protein
MINLIQTFIFPFLLDQTCPQIEPMTKFNTTEYIRSSWFIQQQQVTGYQPPEALNCVAQTINTTNHTVPFYNGTVLSVYNYGRVGGVNGTQENGRNFTLCARQVNESTPARLLNAPCFLPNIFAGPYWVLAAGPQSANYSWAIVSGGSPNIRYPDGNCSTSLNGTNGSGLWLFTRDRYGNIADKYVEQMRSWLIGHGVTVSQLMNVSQTGCNYNGSYLKY